jgi:hypothetical protein
MSVADRLLEALEDARPALATPWRSDMQRSAEESARSE